MIWKNIPIYAEIILQLTLAKPKRGGINHMCIIPQLFPLWGIELCTWRRSALRFAWSVSPKSKLVYRSLITRQGHRIICRTDVWLPLSDGIESSLVRRISLPLGSYLSYFYDSNVWGISCRRSSALHTYIQKVSCGRIPQALCNRCIGFYYLPSCDSRVWSSTILYVSLFLFLSLVRINVRYNIQVQPMRFQQGCWWRYNWQIPISVLSEAWLRLLLRMWRR